MIKETTLRPVGNSTGATIPKAMLDRMQVTTGDRMYLIEIDGGILLTPLDPAFAAAMESFEKGTRKYRNAMQALSRK
jgi:antitoxin MazE